MSKGQDVVVTDDLDWDNIEDVAPSMEAADEDGNVYEEIKDDSNGAEDLEQKASDSEESEDADSEDDIIDAKDSEESNSSDGKGESPTDDKSNPIDIESLEDNAIVKVKVDGELQEISLKEFKNGISGEKAIAKRFSEFDQKEKAHKAEIDSINQYVAELGETMRNKSVVEGLYKIGELNDIPPHIIEQKLIEELIPRISELQEMDENQKQLQYKQKELEYKEKKLESENTQSTAKQAQMELQRNIESTREAHSISEEEWNQSFAYLDQNLPANEEITVDLVAQKVLYDRAGARSEQLLTSFKEGIFAKDVELRNTLHEELLNSPDFTDQDVEEILEQVYLKSQEDAVKEVAKEKKPAAKTTNNNNDEPYQYSELDEDEW